MTNAVPQLHDFLLDSAARLPGKVALVCDGRRLTYGEIDRLSNALAHRLLAQGVARGDRVAVYMDNVPEAALSFWASLKANAVPVMVNPTVKADKLSYLLNDCRASALVSSGYLGPVFAPAAATAPHLRTLVVAGETTPRIAGGVRLLAWDEAIAGMPQNAPPPRWNIDIDLATIIYTSGSTGEAKGVMHTHRSMLAAAVSISTYLEMREDDVVINVLPFSFDYGLYQMIMAFRLGARLVAEKSFSFPMQVVETIKREGVTGFPGVPTVFAMLGELKSLAPADFASVRFVTNTAAALPVKHIELLKRLFPTARIYSMYGLTECKRCSYLPPAALDRKPTSVGVAIPNTELWIVGEDDARLGPNEVGQLVIRGATVMRGYWEKPEETAKRLRPGPLPGEHVLYTGDYCRLDEDGYLYFVGRMDDIIKSRGEKVAPKEVETALVNIAGVKEAAVIGVPDALLGQAVKALVVLEQGARLTERDIQTECHKRLESYMVPKLVAIVPELPKSANGKISKAGLS